MFIVKWWWIVLFSGTDILTFFLFFKCWSYVCVRVCVCEREREKENLESWFWHQCDELISYVLLLFKSAMMCNCEQIYMMREGVGAGVHAGEYIILRTTLCNSMMHQQWNDYFLDKRIFALSIMASTLVHVLHCTYMFVSICPFRFNIYHHSLLKVV